MPEMMEIYKQHADQYDTLVNAEDYQHNLTHFLQKLIDWKDLCVYEAGIGTGRVTRNFIDQCCIVHGFDRERHMLNQCKKNLSQYEDKLHLEVAENTSLPILPSLADIFIEGWSFGHTMGENRDRIPEVTQQILSSLKQTLKPDSPIIIIETLGTHTCSPGVDSASLNAFYAILENQHGFQRHTLRTDYSFTNWQHAAETMGFFFGDAMGRDIAEKKLDVIREYTGVWVAG